MPIGSTSFDRDRYPLRFVLFDNFEDCFSFVDKLTSTDIGLEGIDSWLDPDFPDVLITHTSLSNRIKDFVVNSNPKKDYIIAPFSELARFYDNNEPNKVFESIIRTIKSIQSSPLAYQYHQRFYIPIVGLEAKMGAFSSSDTQIKIWHLQNKCNNFSHKLILTKDTYAVKNIKFPVIKTIKDWLLLWKNPDINNSKSIICTSEAILANVSHAQPDNAFDYENCRNIYDFLTKGLNFNFPQVVFKNEEEYLWEGLSSLLTYSDSFNFKQFIQEYLSIVNVSTHNDFIHLWFSRRKELDRWLLVIYYRYTHNDYLSNLLSRLTSFSDIDILRTIVLDFPENNNDINVRRECVNAISKIDSIAISKNLEQVLGNKLISISQTNGHSQAIKYITTLTTQEKSTLIKWVSDGNITLDLIKNYYPDLYFYLNGEMPFVDDIDWLNKYFKIYREAKIKNIYPAELSNIISKINGSETSFYNWYNKFSTTRTEISEDVDVICWIDGLGVDWIPFICNYINNYYRDNVFLNSVTIARAHLPTITECNKKDLQKLSNFDVSNNKIGDLDKFAHEGKKYPNYIIDEIYIVRRIIDEIIKKYKGQRIAIISDHGISWMAQKSDGLNLAEINSNHFGRVAVRLDNKTIKDKNYLILDDKKTHCALTHKSLSGKTPEGVGTHGGCTPEEVLVPIIVISDSKTDGRCDAEICDTCLSNNPRIKFKIKNMPFGSNAFVVYNNKQYCLIQISNDEYQTDLLELTEKEKCLALFINGHKQNFSIDFTLAANADEDFFNF